MTKKGVRKTIVDGVLSKLMGGGGSGTDVGSNPQSREGSENGDSVSGKKEYVPPSLALQSRKFSSASVPGSGNGFPRTVSQSSVPRPPSRATAAATPTTTPATPVAETFTDISAVYVSWFLNIPSC